MHELWPGTSDIDFFPQVLPNPELLGRPETSPTGKPSLTAAAILLFLIFPCHTYMYVLTFVPVKGSDRRRQEEHPQGARKPPASAFRMIRFPLAYETKHSRFSFAGKAGGGPVASPGYNRKHITTPICNFTTNRTHCLIQISNYRNFIQTGRPTSPPPPSSLGRRQVSVENKFGRGKLVPTSSIRQEKPVITLAIAGASRSAICAIGTYSTPHIAAGR